MRANLEFAAVDQPLKTVLVSSADTGEGKFTVAPNLAVSLAQIGKLVILIDADMRRPNVHEILNIRNENGLSDIFRGRTILQSAMRIWNNEKVAVITGGKLPPNPAELLGSAKMDEILESLKEVADLVIIDGPPFMVADAALLSAKVDGVLLVVRPGYTREDAVKAMMEQVEHTRARVLGVVLNGIPGKLSGYYGGQLHLASYYHGADQYLGEVSDKKTANDKLRRTAGSPRSSRRRATASQR